MGAYQEQIISFLNGRKPASLAVIQYKTGIPSATVLIVLKQLKRMGVICSKYNGEENFWYKVEE